MIKHLALIALILPTLALSSPTYPVKILDVYDGDTFTAEIEIWIGIKIKTVIRIAGIDAPEIRTKCKEEKILARRAKRELAALLTQNPSITNIRLGKYAGRTIAKVILTDGRDLSAILIRKGHARPYDGGAKQSWCKNQ